MTRWEERNPKVQVWADGKAAVVHYAHEMTCEMDGRVVDLAGRDTLVLVVEHDRCWVVADHFSSFPDSASVTNRRHSGTWFEEWPGSRSSPRSPP